VIEGDPHHTNSILFKARCLARIGRSREARELLDALLMQRPNDHRVLQVRGRVEYILQNYAEAVEYYERALEVSPRYAAVLTDLGQARIRMGDWEGARWALGTAVDLGDDSPFLFNAFSQVLEHEGELGEARRFMEQAVKQDPRNAAYHHRMGRISQVLGDHDVAMREYKLAVELDPEYRESLLSLASMAVDEGALDVAKGFVDLAAKVSSVHWKVVWNIRARIALAEGDLAAARDFSAKALSEARDVVNLSVALDVSLARIRAGDIDCSRGESRDGTTVFRA
jgi:tetratricopeptide (TPR) repeat protein